MPRSRPLLALVSAPFDRGTAERLTPSPAARLASLALTLASLGAGLAVVASAAGAQGSGPSDTPLHLAASRFEFVASGETHAPAKPLRVHNGGTRRFTNVRLTRLAYADSARGAAWLVALPRQSAVAPDELATVGTLCVDATGLTAGTYRATAAVAAREVPAPVAITITLVVTDAGARARHAAARCDAAATK
jgi:hypothetical protein